MEEKKLILDDELNADGGKTLNDIGRLSPYGGNGMGFAAAEPAAVSAYTGDQMILADSELNADGGTVVLCADRKNLVKDYDVLILDTCSVSGPGAGREPAIRAEAADSLAGSKSSKWISPASGLELPWGELGIDVVLE